MLHKAKTLLDKTHRELQNVGVKARKRLGQNFLVDESIRDIILGAAEISGSDIVLEVGPGLGVLTEKLSEMAGKVIAVELDKNLAIRLKRKLIAHSNLEIIAADIIKSDLKIMLKGVAHYKVVANIPYYITSPILHYFMYAETRPDLMVIMMQKEVAEDVAAKQGNMRFLSVSMQFYSKPEIVCRVPASSFYPPPKVDSAVVKFNMLKHPAIVVDDIDIFFKVVRCGFAAPRKQLRNSLALGLKLESDEADKLLRYAGIDPQRRPGTLKLEEWLMLYDSFKSSRC